MASVWQEKFRFHGAVALVLLFAWPGQSLAQPGPPAADEVLRTAAFIEGEGVNVRIEYNDGGYANLQAIIRDLRFVGIDHVRDGVNAPGLYGGPSIEAFETVARAGIKFLFVVGGGNFSRTSGTPESPSLEQRMANIGRMQRAAPGCVAAVEGTNEINNEPIVYGGLGSSGKGADELEAALALQRDLYKMVHENPELKGVPVYYFTGYAVEPVPVGPDPATTPGLADYNTQHPYPLRGEPPAAWVTRSQALGNAAAESNRRRAPAVYTETGYSSTGRAEESVNEDVQAKYTLDLLLDAAKEGIAATYLYELLDAYPPGSRQGDAGWGMFDFRGNPKPVAVALHNMNEILRDSGPSALSFKTTPLAFSVSSPSATGHSLEMQSSDGRHIIALWNEQVIWNGKTGVQAQPVQFEEEVRLPGPMDVAVMDPFKGTSPVETFKAAGAVRVVVSDHPIFLVARKAQP